MKKRIMVMCLIIIMFMAQLSYAIKDSKNRELVINSAKEELTYLLEKGLILPDVYKNDMKKPRR